MALKERLEGLDFRARAMFGIGIVALVVLIPFALNNLLNERWILGISSVAIVVVLLTNSLMIVQGRYSPLVTLMDSRPDHPHLSIDIHVDITDHRFFMGIPGSTGVLYYPAGKAGLGSKCHAGCSGATGSNRNGKPGCCYPKRR